MYVVHTALVRSKPRRHRIDPKTECASETPRRRGPAEAVCESESANVMVCVFTPEGGVCCDSFEIRVIQYYLESSDNM